MNLTYKIFSMKIKKNQLYLKSLLFFLFISAMACKKEGPMGPQGEAGKQGEQGLKGEPGPDGSRIYAGAQTPNSTLGAIGDFYFNSQNSDFYGPKTDKGWGTPTNLKGNQGIPGSQILVGVQVPEISLGRVGDFYFQTNTADFYGPKSEQGWGSPSNIRGPKGDDGSRIHSGIIAPHDTIGRIGDYYFNTILADFYGPKQKDGWGQPVNLRGPKGEQGAPGTPGNTGATGATGAPGSKILAGTTVPPSSIGIHGDYYLNTSNGDFYGPKGYSGWGNPINLKGPAGSSNVIYSPWYETSMNLPFGFFSILAPSLTGDIFDKGQVLVYRKSRSDVYSDYYIEQISGKTNATTGYSYRAYVGSIEIYQSPNNNISPNPNVIAPLAAAPTDTIQQFRYVLIPGGTPALSKININNYEQLKKHFNIRD